MVRTTVIGAGIAGLAAAVGLARGAYDVLLLDARRDGVGPGSAISLAPNGQRALDALGLGGAARAVGHLARRTATYRPDGTLLTGLRLPSDAAVLGVRRDNLHQVLRAALPTTVTDVSGVVETVDPEQGVLALSDGTRLRPDLLVGADGVNSAVRPAVAPGSGPAVDAGYQVLRAGVQDPGDLPCDFGLVWGPGLEFGWLRLPDDEVEWHAQILRAPAAPNWSLQDLIARTSTWADPVPALLAATADEAVISHGVRTLRTPLDSFVHERTALLGDAAHPVVPNLGQGASLGIEDAVELVAALSPVSRHGTSGRQVAALARYDRRRRRRTRSVTARAARAARVSLLDSPVLIAARDTALRLTPAALAVRPALAHQRWTAPSISTE